ncbi:MAG: EamA family transporter RarD [Sphingobium sp.]
MQADPREYRNGLIYAFLAYATWGLLPLYFRLVKSISPIEVVAQRVTWCALFILLVLVMRGQVGRFIETLRDKRVLAALTLSGILIAANWLLYVWAVLNGHIVATSLAYFLNPLINVLIGVSFLGERLRPVQWAAIALAAVGAALLGAGAPNMLWISLLLAIAFALYGLIRKLTPVTPLIGLGVETAVLLPTALIGLAWVGSSHGLGFGKDVGVTTLLIGSGLITSLPLMLFAAAARMLPMVTLGFIQYVTPTMVFLQGVLLFGEKLSTAQWASFGLIWTGLILFAGHAIHAARGREAAV